MIMMLIKVQLLNDYQKYDITKLAGMKIHSWLILPEEKLGGPRGYQLWKIKCDCGYERFIQPSTLFGKYSPRSCRSCSGKSKRGNNSPHWKGEEIVPHSVLAKIRCSLNRGRVLDCDLTIKDLENQWIRQHGMCALSGVKLFFPEVQYTNTLTAYGNASVDRIDSSLGYATGNIQFIDKRINAMKQDLDQEEFLNLCRDIVRFNFDE